MTYNMRYPTRSLLASAISASFVGLISQAASATITVDAVDNDVSPAYPIANPIPWNVGGSLRVGDTLIGKIEINNTSLLQATTTYLGYTSTGEGVVTIKDAGTQWTNTSNTEVGFGGTGTLYIQDGGQLNDLIGLLGRQSGSHGEATVSGTNSKWINSGDFLVAYEGKGILNLESGGTIQNVNGYIARLGGSDGTATVRDEGSVWASTGKLNIGDGDKGKLFVYDGAVVSSGAGGTFVGVQTGGVGEVSVQGRGADTNAQARFQTTGTLNIGNFGQGTLNINDGGLVVSSDIAYIGAQTSALGVVNVTGSDARWNSSTLHVGYLATGDSSQAGGTLNILEGGVVSSLFGSVGDQVGSTGELTISGAGSEWNTNGNSFVSGYRGDGSTRIADGGLMTNAIGHVGYNADVVGVVEVDGIDSDSGTASTWYNSSDLHVSYNSTGTAGGEPGGKLNILNGGFVTNNIGYVGFNLNSNGLVTVVGDGSLWENRAKLFVGNLGNGELIVEEGGTVSVQGVGRSDIGSASNSDGLVTVTGRDALTDAASELNYADQLSVGYNGIGELRVENGGNVSTGAYLLTGFLPGSKGTVKLSGEGSSITTGTIFYVGRASQGFLDISDGASLTSATGFMGTLAGSNGQATIDGAGSNWTVTDDMYIGGFYDGEGDTAVLTLTNHGRLEVRDVLRIFAPGTLTINGGVLAMANPNAITTDGTLSFNFGTLEAISDFALNAGDDYAGLLGGTYNLTNAKTLRIDGVATLNTAVTLNGGTLSADNFVNPALIQFNLGKLQITGAGTTSIGPGGPLGAAPTLSSGQTLDVTDTLAVDAGSSLVLDGGWVEAGTMLVNGLLRGGGSVDAALTNNAGGEIRFESGKTLAFAGPTAANDGQLSLQGGTAQFGQALSNNVGGDILGRGTLIVGGAGLTNEGDLALSNGQTDVFGDVVNQATGRVIISGNADVTFWGDVDHNGAMFNVSAGSSATFFGEAGFGISGGGDVYFEADITPGNSPGIENFGGNVTFGVLSALQIEVAGTLPGAGYDQVNVAGDLNLGGTLDVVFLDGFNAAYGDSFAILNAGQINGSFDGLSLAELNGGLYWDVQQTGTELTITAVPEPSSLALICVCGLLLARRRRAA